MKTKEFISVIVYNICVLITFGFIAFVFNHWWIILFSLLFITFPKYVHKYYRICDKCGKKSASADSPKEALDKAIKSGWVHIEEGNKDYCLDCALKIGEKISNE